MKPTSKAPSEVAATGYKEVEFAGSSISPKDVRAILDKNALVPPLHVGYSTSS